MPTFVIEHKSLVTGEWRQSLQFPKVIKAKTAGLALDRLGRLLRRLKLPVADFRLRRV